MKTVFSFVFFVFILSVNIQAHPIHVSVANMNYSHDSSKIEYSVKLFYDDFQTLINYKYNTLINFANQNRMTTKEQQSVIDYINRNFVLTDADREVIDSKFTGWKVEDFSVWLYFCADVRTELSSVRLTNTIMLDLFADQVNLVILQMDDIQKGFEFNKRTTSYTFTP